MYQFVCQFLKGGIGKGVPPYRNLSPGHPEYGLDETPGCRVHSFLCHRGLSVATPPVCPDLPASGEIKTGRPYPIKPVLHHFRRRYFTNQVSWMIALAILERPQAIGIWGVDMCVRSPALDENEYGNQRPSCEWLIGWAEGAGIEVVIPDECELLKHPYLYGFEHRGNAFRIRWEARRKELEERMARQQQKAEAAQAKHNNHVYNVAMLRGAIDAHNWAEQFSFPDAEARAEFDLDDEP